MPVRLDLSRKGPALARLVVNQTITRPQTPRVKKRHEIAALTSRRVGLTGEEQTSQDVIRRGVHENGMASRSNAAKTSSSTSMLLPTMPTSIFLNLY